MKKIVAPGLALFFLLAGWGPFISRGLSNAWVLPWIAGYLVLVFIISYEFVFSPAPVLPVPFRFIALGVIFMNFIMQLSGGAHSTLWSAYYLFAVVFAALSRLPQALFMVLVVIVVEGSSLLISGQYDPSRWPAYAGFGLSLAGVAAATSYLMGHVLKEADQAKDAVKRLEEKADAVDPLADPAKLESLMQESRQAANLKTAQEREESLSSLLTMIYQFVPAHTYALFVKERRDGNELFVLRACKSESSDGLVPIGTALDPAAGKTRIDLCAERTLAQYLPELSDNSALSLGYYDPRAKSVAARSAMVIPILSQDQENVVAVLSVDKTAPDAFPEDAQEMLKRFSAFFLEVIEKTQISLDLNTKAAHFGALHDISTALSGSLDFHEIMKQVIPRIESVIPFDYCACAFISRIDGQPHLRFIALHGYDPALNGRTFPLKESAVAAYMCKQWEDQGTVSFYTADYGERGKEIGLFPFRELQRHIRSLYGRLLVAKDELIGVFFLASLRPDAFSQYHRDYLLDTLMNQVAMVANNSLLHQRIDNLARTDGLTGLLNHRTFMEMLGAKYRELERIPRPFSILLMDIDKFKGVNDKYGHPVGDIAIKSVARILHDTIRGTDFVARYGGEEFAVGMVETDRKGAEQMAERVRSIMERTVITKVFDGELTCTLSIGVATFPEDTEDWTNLVTMADDALYHAKRTGRNRVSLHRDAVKEPAQPAKS